MNHNHTNRPLHNAQFTLPQPLRVILALLLLLLGVAPAPSACAQTNPHRIVKT